MVAVSENSSCAGAFFRLLFAVRSVGLASRLQDVAGGVAVAPCRTGPGPAAPLAAPEPDRGCRLFQGCSIRLK